MALLKQEYLKHDKLIKLNKEIKLKKRRQKEKGNRCSKNTIALNFPVKDKFEARRTLAERKKIRCREFKT